MGSVDNPTAVDVLENVDKKLWAKGFADKIIDTCRI